MSANPAHVPASPVQAADCTDFVENLGIAVRQLRDQQGWSQEQLAERSGLNRSYVGEVERGQVVASVLTAQKLAQAFEVSVVELFSRCENIHGLRRQLSCAA